MVDIYPLQELCLKEITDGTHKTPTYSDSGYVFLSSKNVTTGKINWDDIVYIPESLHNELYSRLSPQKDDILLAKNGTTGVAAIVDRDTVFDIYVSLALIRPNPNIVVPRYLLHALNSETSKRYFDSHLKGIGVPNLHLTYIRKTPIRLPNKDAQNRIVCILDNLDHVISLRKQQLTKLDELIKARFVEMFGDIETNPYGWRIVTLGTIVKSCESGWSGNGIQRKRKAGEIAVLKVSSITKGYFIPEECKVLDNQSEIKKFICPEKGDLLFSRANTRELVGATALITEDYPELILPDKLWKIRFFDSANVFYVKYVLSYDTVRAKISAASTGTSGSMYNVSMNKFKSMTIPLPSLNLQEQFADFVRQVDKSRSTIQQSLDNLEILKKSLMQEFFS